MTTPHDDIQTVHGSADGVPTPKPLAFSLGDYTAEAYETAQGIRWRVRHIGDLEDHFMVPVLGGDGQQKRTKSGDLRWRQRVTRGPRTTLPTPEPLDEVDAWVLMLQEQEKNVPSFLDAQRKRRGEDLTSIRAMVAEQLPDVDAGLPLVEQVRELAQALSGARTQMERAPHGLPAFEAATQRQTRLAMTLGISNALVVDFEHLLGSCDGTEATFGALVGVRIKELLVTTASPPAASEHPDERFLQVDPEADDALSREQCVAVLAALTDPGCDHADLLPHIFPEDYDWRKLADDARLAWDSPDNPITLALVDAEASALSAHGVTQRLMSRSIERALEGEADTEAHPLIREVAAVVRVNRERADEIEMTQWEARRAQAMTDALAMICGREQMTRTGRMVARWLNDSSPAPSDLIAEEVERLLNLLGQEQTPSVTRRVDAALSNLLADAGEAVQPSTVRPCGVVPGAPKGDNGEAA